MTCVASHVLTVFVVDSMDRSFFFVIAAVGAMPNKLFVCNAK